MNLFINAIDAMPQGGELWIKTCFPNDSKLQILIEHTGCGIAREDLSHIFDPFYTKKDGGTGLGLSITHGIIKEHKGTIKVLSDVGKGTTFIIELPVAS